MLIYHYTFYLLSYASCCCMNNHHSFDFVVYNYCNACTSLFHIFLVWGRHISHATPFVSVARITSSPTPAIYGGCAALAHLQRHARRLRRLIFLLKFFERHAKIAQRHGPYYPQSCRKIHLEVMYFFFQITII